MTRLRKRDRRLDRAAGAAHGARPAHGLVRAPGRVFASATGRSRVDVVGLLHLPLTNAGGRPAPRGPVPA